MLHSHSFDYIENSGHGILLQTVLKHLSQKKNIASPDMAAVSQAIANACFGDDMSWVMHLDREFLVQLIDYMFFYKVELKVIFHQTMLFFV